MVAGHITAAKSEYLTPPPTPSPGTNNPSPPHRPGFKIRLLTYLRHNAFSTTFLNTFGIDFSLISGSNLGAKINKK